MSNSNSDFVFLMDCGDFSEAQVVKSFLESQGFHPRVRNEQTRTIAPHLNQALGKLTLEIPEFEYMDASRALESREPQLRIVTEEILPYDTQAMAKKALWNAILGCVLVPVICNFYSMLLGWRVLRHEMPLSRISRNRLLLAIVFNSIAFWVWLAIVAPAYLQQRAQ